MKTIAIDFDGVIHKYSKGWQDGSIYDGPIYLALGAIQEYMMRGYSVFIFSTRNPRQIKRWLENSSKCRTCDYDESVYLFSPYSCQVIPFWTKFWNKKNVLGITKRKLPAYIYIDDRAYKFKGDWKKAHQEILKELED